MSEGERDPKPGLSRRSPHRSKDSKMKENSFDEKVEFPVSPLSSIASRGNKRKHPKTEWDNFNLNHSEVSELELDQSF